jgi:hypothetical protein
MNLSDFQSLVAEHASSFRGVDRESVDSLAAAERTLGCTLPKSLKWLLSHCGYSSACGVDSLDESVQITEHARHNLGLPSRYVVLNDWHDAGVVYLDTSAPDANGEYKVFWVGAHNFARLAIEEPMDKDVSEYADFPAWVLSRLESALDDQVV